MNTDTFIVNFAVTVTTLMRIRLVHGAEKMSADKFYNSNQYYRSPSSKGFCNARLLSQRSPLLRAGCSVMSASGEIGEPA